MLFARIRSWWLGVRRGDRLDAEMLEEFREQPRLRADDLVRAGLPRAEAERRARVEFGPVDPLREDARRSRGLGPFDALRFSWLDFKLGLRTLAKRPGLTLVGGLGMAVVIALGAGTFALVAGALAPLPFDQGDRIVTVEVHDTRWNDAERRVVHEFAAWREQLTSLQDLSAFRMVDRNLIAPGGSPTPVEVAEISPSGFRVTRVPAMLGRSLLDDDARPAAQPVLVLGYDAWRARFAADSGVVGSTVRLGAMQYTVVGVMPEGYAFPLYHQYWVPFRTDPTAWERRRGPAIHMFARLSPDATLDGARAELTAMGQQLATQFPETHARLRPRVMPYTAGWIGDGGEWQLGLVQLLVLLLLLVVCTNVATLVYARTAARHGEIAVRTALGASRGRIVTHLFAEALALAGLSAIAGLVMLNVALDQIDRIMLDLAGTIPFWISFRVSAGTLAYTALLALLSAVIVGVVPAFKATGRRVQWSLQQLSNTAAGMHLGGVWTVLIVAQAAFAVGVIPAAVYYASEFVRYGSARPGYAADQFLIFRARLDREVPASVLSSAYDSVYTERYRATQRELARRLEADPAVGAVLRLTGMPGQSPLAYVEVPGAPMPAGDTADSAGARTVGALAGTARVDGDYFRVLDIPIVAGREFHPGDAGTAGWGVFRDADGDGYAEAHAGEGGRPNTAVIVNRSFVREVLGGHGAVGRRVRYSARMDDDASAAPMQEYEIVGVAEDFPVTPMEPDSPHPMIYHPLAEGALTQMTAVRVRGTPAAAFTPRLREIAEAVDPSLRLHGIAGLEDALREEHRAMRMTALAIALVTLSVLLLSAGGAYAMMSFTVAKRRREIGIRIALGAERSRVVRGVLARSLRPLLYGVAVGALAAPFLLCVDAPWNAAKAASLVAVAALMVLVGVLASIGPTRRSLRIQPVEALKDA